MFGSLRRHWKDLVRTKPGERFRNRYYGRKKERPSPLVKAVYVVLGTVLMLAGIVLLPAPGPGMLVVLVGAAMLARESLFVARVCDCTEMKVRTWLRRVRRARKRA
jgi:uncharacterized protein (TIGR02611 family)